MKAWSACVFLLLLLVACGSPEPSGGPSSTTNSAIDTTTPSVDPASTTDPAEAVTIRTFQEQRDCCYEEGQVSFISVNGADHEVHLSRIGIVPLIEIQVPPGGVEIESWQQPCSGNCGFLDPPVNQCSMAIDAASPQTIRLLVSFEPGPDPCELTTLQEDPTTSVPVSYGFRTPLPSCGDDFTMQMAMFGESSRSPERQCFVDAHAAGEPAELNAYEPPDPDSETDDVLDLVIYRTRPGQGIEVFVNKGPEFDEWLTFGCETLTEIDGPALFALEACSEPQAVA